MELNNIYKKESEIEFQFDETLYNENLLEYLEEYYPEIKNAMDKENYVIEYPKHTFFVELKNDDEIAGFYTVEWNILHKTNIINEFYVMPKHRGNNLFAETMKLLSILPNETYVLRNPTRLLVEILLKNNLACKISDDFVVSYIKIGNYLNEYYSNTSIEELYIKENAYDIAFLTSEIYNMKYSSTIALDKHKILSKKKNTVIYFTPRQQDLDRYNLDHKLTQITIDSTEKDSQIINTNNIGQKFLTETSEEFLNILTVEHIFGSEEKLHEDMMELIENTAFTKEDVINAINKVDVAFNKYEITPLSLITRFNYLLIHPTLNAVLTGDEKLREDKCPYCHSMRQYSNSTCNNCGFNFIDYEPQILADDEDIFENLDDNIDPQTGLDYIFLEEILEKGYNPEEIYLEQLELAVNSFLKEIDENPSYNMMPIFEEDFFVSEEDVISYLKTNKLVEEKINRNYDENFMDIDIFEEIPYNYIDEYTYKITKKGRRHYKKNRICLNFIKFFDEMDYHNFKIYCNQNPDKKILKIVEDYLDVKINESLKNNDRKLYIRMCESEEKIALDSNNEEWKKILKTFICQENDKYLETKSTEGELSKVNQIKLFLPVELHSKTELKKLYDEAYESIEFEEVKIRKKENWESIERYINEDFPLVREFLEEEFDE